MNKEPEYRKEDGGFVFYWDGKFHFRCDAVAVVGQHDLAGGEGAFLRKHGCPETMHKWFKKERQDLLAKGGEEWARQLFLVESDKWDIGDLNKCIQITGYIGILIKKMAESKDYVDELLEGFDEG